MLFNSLSYIIFLSIVVCVYYLLPHKYRWAGLLIASFVFCLFWSIDLLLWILIITAIAYVSGILLSARRNKMICSVGVISILLILFVFKYINFSITQINGLLRLFQTGKRINLINNIVMPIGISFYSFQNVGYILDVYKGKCTACRHPGKFALYSAFFPHIAEGPIDRTDNLLMQMDEEHRFDYDTVRNGMVMILFGMFKKVVIADRLAVLADTVFNDVSKHSGQAFWLASVFYTIQIYCDFSGYTDIAIGSAKMMGFRLVENFNYPYLAVSITDFWRKWHMSLSRWFRDYVYIPLGGNRVSKVRWGINILIVFLISGLWHGADWTFILWGFFHGLFQVMERFIPFLNKKYDQGAEIRSKLFTGIKIIVTFGIVNYLWILFRANSMSDFIYIFRHFLVPDSNFKILNLGMDKKELVFSFILIFLLALCDILTMLWKSRHSGKLLDAFPLPVRWIVYMTILFAIILFGKYGTLTAGSFIYFQF